MEIHRPDKGKLLIGVLLAAILLAAFVVRFYHLSKFGLWSCDAVIYTSDAKHWFDHDFINQWSKPGYHLLGWATILLVGYHDYILPYLNSGLDVLNVLLIFFIGLKIGMRGIFALAAAISYAFLPYILSEAARGLPHLSSETFVLASFYVFLIYFNGSRRNLWWLFLTGFFAIFAGNIHPTLLCTALFYFLATLAASISWPPFSRRNLWGFDSLFVLCLGGLCAFLLLAFIMAPKPGAVCEALMQMKAVVLSHRQSGDQGNQGGILAQTRFVFGTLPRIFTVKIERFFLLVVGAFILLKARTRGVALIKRRPVSFKFPRSLKARNLFILCGFIVFFLLVNFITAKCWLCRLTIPVVPLMVLVIVYLADSFSEEYPKLRLGPLFLLAAMILSAWNLAANKELIVKTPTSYRQMANALLGKVDTNHRLLVTPSFLFARDYELEAVYFDGNDVYRIKGPWKPQLQYLQQFNIKYVAVAKYLNNGDWESFTDDFEHPDEKQKAEYLLMLQGLKEMDARLIYASNKLLIFEVPGSPSLSSAVMPPWYYPFFNEQRRFEPVDRRL